MSGLDWNQRPASIGIAVRDHRNPHIRLEKVGGLRWNPQCLPYEPETVVLEGNAQRALAYGPPGFGETPDRDAKEIFYSLQLAAPICVLAGDDDDQPAEKSIKQLQIAFIKIPFDKTIAGQRVRIIGTLFHSETGHHHTKVLISPTRIERQ